MAGRETESSSERGRPEAYALPRQLRDYLVAAADEDAFRFSELAETNASVMNEFKALRILYTNPDPKTDKFHQIILHGATGVGKTTLVKALWGETMPYAASFKLLTSADFIDSNGRITAASINAKFKELAEEAARIEGEDEEENARRNRGKKEKDWTFVNRRFFICIDEAESVFLSTKQVDGLPAPESWQIAATNTAKTAIDNLARRKNISLFMTTNNITYIDSAIKSRSGSKLLKMELPTKEELPGLFGLYIRAAADQYGEEIFHPDLMDKVTTYRTAAKAVADYVRNHPKMDSRKDRKFGELVSTVRAASRELTKMLTEVTKEAEGLSPRDVASILDELAEKVLVQLREKKAAEGRRPGGRRDKPTVQFNPITPDAIKRAILTHSGRHAAAMVA